MLVGPRYNSAPLADVFGRLHDGGGVLSNVFKHGDSLLHLALERLGVIEPNDGKLVERHPCAMCALSTNEPELPPCSSSTATR